MGVTAVTFDLWNTLLVEAGDGLIRPRAVVWQQILAEAQHDVDLRVLEGAHEAALVHYKAAWERNEQFRSLEATDAACEHLGLSLEAHTREALVHSFRDAGLTSDTRLVPGALDVLQALRGADIKIAVICDIGLTPSTALAERLGSLGILELVDVLAWSDVFGVYKPDPSIFEWTLDELGAHAPDACHVGDRLRTDVGGARAAGMRTVRFRGVYDDPASLPEADHVIDHLSELVELLHAGDERG